MLLRILQNVIEKSFINWRVLSLVKINTRISGTPVYREEGNCSPDLLSFESDKVYKHWTIFFDVNRKCESAKMTLGANFK
jgi:hypothetical protein